MGRMIASFVAGIFLACAGVAHADEVTPRSDVVSGVIIRAAPSTDSDRLGLLRPNETLSLVRDLPRWYEVELDGGRTGFVSRRWTRRVAGPGQRPRFAAYGADAPMFAHFVYVGQGAGAILEFPCGVAVIDTGGQYSGEPEGDVEFNAYLDAFFEAHPQYGNTIDVLFTSHPHRDHLDGLPLLLEEGAPRVRVRNVVDNGQSGAGSSVRKQVVFREAVLESGGAYSGVSVNAAIIPRGVTNDVIDPIPREDHEEPIDCPANAPDPEFTIYWGGWTQSQVRALGGRGRYLGKPNNHSLVIRVDYGEASFLFTGDLEIPAIEDMLAIYEDRLENFDVDVYHVGHHGAENATTVAFLEAMSPQIAIISMGDLLDSTNASARGHGHPRAAILRLLQQEVSGERDDPIVVQAFETRTELVDIEIGRAIYATGWQHHIVLRADPSGAFSLDHER